MEQAAQIVEASFTRPADTTAYAAGDAMSDSTSSPTNMTFSQVTGYPTGGGVIDGVTVVKSDPTVTDCDFDLVLFTAAPTAFEDNAAWDPSDAEAATVVGIVEFLNADAATSANNAIWQRTVLDLTFKCGALLQDLYGVLVARGTYTPASGETFTVRLHLRGE